MSSSQIPSSILILGSGVFGLSTAYSLTQDIRFKDTKITLVDKSTFPAPDAASIDTSRIIRSDYADIAYARLGLEAQERWRHDWWGKEVYHESGLALVTNADEHTSSTDTGQTYMQKSLENGRKLGLKPGTRASGGDLEILKDRASISSTFKQPDDSSSTVNGGGAGDFGYVNWRGGWADAEGGMRLLRERVEATNRVDFLHGEVKRLLFSPDSYSVHGAIFSSDEEITADLTILATGAWTPALLDLRGITSATGQVLAYLSITDAEQETLGSNPTLLNETTGLFIIPPSKNILKVARHGYGYANPIQIPNPEPSLSSHTSSSTDGNITVSLPRTSHSHPGLTIPAEAEIACRDFLTAAIPSLADRPFTHTRICWYTDTASGDWLIAYHPRYENLFVATGGSGHAYKFLPVIGDKIIDCLLGETPKDFREKWAWPEERGSNDHVWTDDWRGGRKGMTLDEE